MPDPAGPIDERPVAIPGPTGAMLGVLSQPADAARASGTAVVLIVGGAQYRVGSHRQFVRLARALASAGHTALRFDLPGQGDSPGDPVPFDAADHCLGAAMDCVSDLHGVQRVVLWGLCDGASAALLAAASARPRLAGLALLNPWVRSEASLARTQVRHYYRQRLREPDFWRKLLRGAVGGQALRDLLANLQKMGHTTPATPRFQDRMAQAWHGFPGAILLLLSERDLTAQEFVEYAQADALWANWATHPRLERHALAGADHTCSSNRAMHESETILINWLSRLG